MFTIEQQCDTGGLSRHVVDFDFDARLPAGFCLSWFKYSRGDFAFRKCDIIPKLKPSTTYAIFKPAQVKLGRQQNIKIKANKT